MATFSSIFRKFKAAEPERKVITFASLNKKLNLVQEASNVPIERSRVSTAVRDPHSSTKKVIKKVGAKSSPLSDNEKSLINCYVQALIGSDNKWPLANIVGLSLGKFELPFSKAVILIGHWSLDNVTFPFIPFPTLVDNKASSLSLGILLMIIGVIPFLGKLFKCQNHQEYTEMWRTEY